MTPKEFKQKHDEYFKDYSEQIAVLFYGKMVERFQNVVEKKSFSKSMKYTFAPNRDELKCADTILKLVSEKGWHIEIKKGSEMYDPEYFVVFVD